MFYEFSLTVPANTLAASPAELTAVLAAGTVTNVSVLFPAGSSGMVEVVIWRRQQQAWPTNPEGVIIGENVEVTWPEDFDLSEPPFEFILRGWSPGTTYQHIITFRFALMPLALAVEARRTPSLLRRLGDLVLGRPTP